MRFEIPLSQELTDELFAFWSAIFGPIADITPDLFLGAELEHNQNVLFVERIENFPGFPQGISGAELGPRMQEQAMDAGAHFLLEDVTGLLLDNPYRMLTTSDSNHRAKPSSWLQVPARGLWGYPVRRSLMAAGCPTVPPVMVLCFAARWWAWLVAAIRRRTRP